MKTGNVPLSIGKNVLRKCSQSRQSPPECSGIQAGKSFHKAPILLREHCHPVVAVSQKTDKKGIPEIPSKERENPAEFLPVLGEPETSLENIPLLHRLKERPYGKKGVLHPLGKVQRLTNASRRSKSKNTGKIRIEAFVLFEVLCHKLFGKCSECDLLTAGHQGPGQSQNLRSHKEKYHTFRGFLNRFQETVCRLFSELLRLINEANPKGGEHALEGEALDEIAHLVNANGVCFR